jgi:single-stranded DNA-binding protein
VFWGLDAKKCVDEVKKGATVRLEGKKVVREYAKDGELRMSHEIHRPRGGKLSLEVISAGREQHPGNPIEVKGIVKYDPELKMSPGGKVYMRITVEASEVKLDGQEVDAKSNQKQTAVFWEKAAENLAATVKRGMPVAIKGELVTREYEDREHNRKTGSEIHKAQLEQLELGKKNGTAQGKGGRARDADLER